MPELLLLLLSPLGVEVQSVEFGEGADWLFLGLGPEGVAAVAKVRFLGLYNVWFEGALAFHFEILQLLLLSSPLSLLLSQLDCILHQVSAGHLPLDRPAVIASSGLEGPVAEPGQALLGFLQVGLERILVSFNPLFLQLGEGLQFFVAHEIDFIDV